MKGTEVGKRCMSFLEELYKDPLTLSFREINPDPTYLEQCPNVMDLRHVRSKLEEGKYQGFNDWVSDMYLIFDNTIKINPQSLFGIAAKYYKNKITKFVNQITNMNSRNIEQHLIDAYAELQSLLLNPPSHSYTCDGMKRISQIPQLQPFTAERINKITNGLNNILNAHSDKSKALIERMKKAGLASTKSPNIDLALAGRDLLFSLEHSI